MVFESIVVDLMNKFLGAYIENLDASQLKLGIWGGDAVLENLHVKGDALQDLDLPLQIKSGFVGKLTLKIPWKNLYKEAVVATLDSLYILAVPNSSVQYDAKKEAERAEKAKQAQLQEIEDQLQKKLEKKDAAPKQDGFVEKLATQVIKNIQVHVGHIHIRYEDEVTIPGQPFAFGVTLHKLDLETTNENWIPTLLDESVKIIYKMVSMKSLAVYWNTKSKTMLTKAPRVEQLKVFRDTIANEGFLPDDFTYVIKPMTMAAKLRLNPHPENDLSLPKVLLSVVLEELGLHLACSQFHDMMEFIESIDRMSINDPFRKFKPSVPLSGNAKIWWKYAYNSVLEAGVSSRMKMFSWKHIKEHRQRVRAYKQMYKERLKQKKPPKDLLDKLVKMENDIDVFNITLARQSAEVEMVKSGQVIRSKKSAHQEEESSSWFGGWFGGKKKKEEKKAKEAGGSTIDTVMDDKEKQLLYEAIGYSEGEGPVNTQFPKDYVEINVDAGIKKVSVGLKDDKNLDGAKLLNLMVDDISAAFKMRTAANAISVAADLKNFAIDGLEQNGNVPHIISSDLLSDKNLPMAATTLNLLQVGFETNPLDESCNQRISVKTRPLRIVYDAKTINQLIEFFKPPEDIQLQQIRAAAALAYEDIKDQTATGLQHVMETRKITDIDVQLMSSYVVMPKNGSYYEGCEALVLDLGEVVFKSLNEGQTPALKGTFSFTGDSELDLTKMRSQAYDKFLIDVKKIQLLIADKGENWALSRTLNSSPLHVLEPMNVTLLLQKCMVENDANLPKLKVEGELPIVALKISDAKLHNAIELATSIPLPEPGPEEEAPLVEYDSWNMDGDRVRRGDMKTMTNVFEDKYASNRSLNSTATSSDEFFTAESDASDMEDGLAEKLARKKLAKKQDGGADAKQLTEVYASFNISKISVGLSQTSNGANREILHLSVNNFGVGATVRTWDTGVKAHLGSITAEYMQGTLPDGRPMYILDTPLQDATEHLLMVEILIAKRNAPDFATTYENIEQNLKVKVNVVEINANSKALLEIKAFAEKLAPPPAEVKEQVAETILTPEDSKSTGTLVTANESEATFGTAESALSKYAEPSKVKPKKPVKKRRADSEVVDMRLVAALDTFKINLSNESRQIASVAVEGISAVVSLLPSCVCVTAKLRNLLVVDPYEETLYRQIVTAQSGDVLTADIVNFNDATSGEAYSDMNNVDTSVSLKLGSMRVVFVKRFVDTMVNFAENFQDVQQAAAEASAKAQEAAKKSMMKLVERNPRIKLDVALSVPKIFIPRNSKSLEVIMADLGDVKVGNHFTIVGAEDTENPAVCENMDVSVTNIKVALCNLNEKYEIISEHQILEPVSATVALKRNLAASWFHDVPDVTIEGSMHAINVKISQNDMIHLMSTLNENMTEAAPDASLEEIVVPSQSNPVAVAPTEGDKKESDGKGDITGDRLSREIARIEVWDTLKLDFKMPSVRVDLFMDTQRELPLARFIVQTLGVDVRMGSDSSMDVNARLEDISLSDTRLTHQSGITRYIQRKRNTEQSPESHKHVVHANITQKANGSMDIVAAVGSVSIILCLEFILKVADIFVGALPTPTESKSTVSVESEAEKTIPKAPSVESVLSEATTVVATKPHEPEAAVKKSSALHIEFKLHKPDIILVTDISSDNCEALVLSMQVAMKFDISESGREQKLDASIKDLQLIGCPFEAIKDITEDYKKVLSPCKITLRALMSETVQEFHVVASKIRITATPIVINTITEAAMVLTPESKSEMALHASTHRVAHDVWDVKKVSDMHFWFIDRPEEELIPKAFSAVLSKTEKLGKFISESLNLSVPDIMLQLESGHGHHTVPLLIAELKVSGEIKNWSSQLEGKFQLSLGVVYFNESLSVWEPLVEPVEMKPGELDSSYDLWTVEAEIKQCAVGQEDVTDASANAEDAPPLLSVSVASKKILHTTFTNAALKVINSLSRGFADAAMSKKDKKKKVEDEKRGEFEKISAAAKIRNMLSFPLTIVLGSDLNVVAKNGPDKNTNNEYRLGYKDYLAVDFAKDQDMGVWALLTSQQKMHASDGTLVRVHLPGSNDSASFDISKTGTTLSTLTQDGKCVHVVCVIKSKGGIRTVTLRSTLVVVNHLAVPLKVMGQNGEVVGDVEPNGHFPLATKFTENEKLFVKPYSEAVKVNQSQIDWKQMIQGDEFQSERVVQCLAAVETSTSVNLNVEVISEQVQSEQKNDTCYEIHVRPVAVFRNYLPYDIEFAVKEEKSTPENLIAGNGSQVFDATVGKSHLSIKILSYRDKSWTGSFLLEPGLPEMSVIDFKTEAGDSMVLGKQVTYREGFMKITLYSPYWMVNETGFPLDYKAGDDVTQHPEEKQDFILFSFTSKSFLSKNKLQLRVCNSNFSDSFSIDAVGSTGTIICKTKNFNYIVGTNISVTSFGLTKIVTFSCYYTIVNKSSEDLEILEAGIENAPVLPLNSNSSCLFWPESKTDQIQLRIKGNEKSVSKNVRYSKLDSGVLVKVGDTPLFVDVAVTESAVTITIKNYYVGSSAILLINHTQGLSLTYSQNKVAEKEKLDPGVLRHFLWSDPTAKREITWKIDEGGKEKTHDVLHELGGEMKFKFDGKERIVYYAVFVDGLQRVLLFTENKKCADAVERGLGLERANLELSVELQGLSCSITDAKAKREVMYMAITSSGIIWEEKPKKRWTALPLKYGSLLEEAHQKANQKTIESEKYEFDITNMQVVKPYKCELRRFFSPGLWLQYTVSDHQVMIHAKVNRLQVDNQLPAAVFPVILHPIPLPKTIAIDSSPKPFIEFSFMQRTSEHQTFTHIKYFKVLVQEFSVKLDMGFISAILPVFGANEVKSTPERDLKYFNYDIATAKKPIRDGSEEVTDDAGITYFDLLHLSPIKVHVSFSMQNTCYDEGNQTSNVVVLPFNALAVVLKSVGVTVSDIDDVVFKLGYFERQYQFFSTTQFQGAITMHYAGQAIKQLYVLVFGLDVIGNPYGLVMGIAEGVTDLFYEPYQGMIQGPGEFAEGLALGAVSLLGHTIGGAAGAVSRVTGALGKGVASLTMDDEYKKKRQMQKNKPTDLKEGLARGGKGLVMGFVGGVTGVVTKPVEGAKKEGAAGFFKGVGKGIIGIVARPASGVIDLASNTFEGIQKLADMSEDVKRMRPARWVDEDTGILQPYRLKKAQGKAILLEAEKGKFAEDAKYIDHVPIDKDKKSFLMLTNKMIVEVHTGDFFGQWNSAWSFPYEDVVEEPHKTKDGIKLVGAKTKKLFGSKSHTKTIAFHEDRYVDHMLELMKRDWNAAQKGRSATSTKESKHHRGHVLSFSRKSKHDNKH